jgi:hypothetical protein
MNDQVPSLAFADLLAYTDFLAQRWLHHFEHNPGSLEVDGGGKTGSLHDLVTHIFQIENFFADLLLQEGAGATARPGKLRQAGFPAEPPQDIIASPVMK